MRSVRSSERNTPLIYRNFKSEGLTMKVCTTGVFINLICIGKHQNFGALDCALGDRDPDDPRGVPWDQNFCLKIFVSLSYNNVILFSLSIYLAENSKI